MAGGGGSTTTRTELDPVQREALESILRKSEELYAQGPLEYYPGQNLADQWGQVEEGHGQIRDALGDMGGLLEGAQGQFNDLLGTEIGADTSALMSAINKGMGMSVWDTPGLAGALSSQLNASLPGRGMINAGASDLLSSDILSDPRLGEGFARLFASSDNIVDDPRLANVWERGFNASLPDDPRTLAAADAAVAPLYDQFQEEILPGITSQAVSQGAFGGDRMAINQAIAGREVTRAAGETRADIMERALRAGLQHESDMVGNFISGRGTELSGLSSGLSSLVQAKSADLQGKAAGLSNLVNAGSAELTARGNALRSGIEGASVDMGNYQAMLDDMLGTQRLDLDSQIADADLGLATLRELPSLQESMLLPGQTLTDLGYEQLARQQARIDADRERWEFNQYAQEAALDRFASRVAGLNFGGLTTSQSDADGLFGK